MNLTQCVDCILPVIYEHLEKPYGGSILMSAEGPFSSFYLNDSKYQNLSNF